MILSGVALPTHPGCAASHLHDRGVVRVQRRRPAKAVAAKVGETTAGIQVSLERIEQARTHVFGMPARQYAAVTLQELHAPDVQVMIRGHIEAKPSTR